ncbi:hypothetical protein [Streptomyces brasiliscabiei]
MQLKIGVERRPGQYFLPYIEDHDSGRIVFHFHNDDITEHGALLFAEALTEQARRWMPRAPETPRGPQIPVTMDLRTDLPDGVFIVVDDRPTRVAYTMRQGLMSERGATSITRQQSERSPDWERRPVRHPRRLHAV